MSYSKLANNSILFIFIWTMAKRKVKKRSISSKFKALWSSVGLKAAVVFSFILLLFFSYKLLIDSNIAFRSKKYYFFVEKPISIHDLADTLASKKIVNSSLYLRIMAEIYGLNKVQSGLFEFDQGWSSFSIVSQLYNDTSRAYVKTKVKAYKLRKNVVRSTCSYFPEINRSEVWSLLRDKQFLDSIGFNRENVFSIFLPGSYYLPKELEARELLEAMHGNYVNFWGDEERGEKLNKLDLSPEEAMILASIVYSETKLKDEMPLVAGVYLNRLKKNMRLQSDPTVIYAAHKFGKRRVYYKDRRIKSRYNTYLHKGLPPGPIHCTPEVAIDAVLNYSDHDYLYFCAKDDMSGCHLFTQTFDEHKENADKYRKALNRLGVY